MMFKALFTLYILCDSAFALVASDIDPEPALLDLASIVSLVVLVLVMLYHYKTLNNLVR